MTERLMTILEGSCPDCGADTEIESIGGYHDWLRDKCPYSRDGVTVSRWHRPDEMFHGAAEVEANRLDNPGAVNFICTACRKEHYVEATAQGDWVGR